MLTSIYMFFTPLLSDICLFGVQLVGLFTSNHSPETNAYNQKNSSVSPVTCTIEILPGAFSNSATSCQNESNGNIFFDTTFIINGTWPYTFDWDDLSTPQNDVFNDDGSIALDSIPAGTYELLITDASGCSTYGSTIVEDPVFYAITLIDSVGLCKLTGGIQVVQVIAPPTLLNINWDFAFTPYDDNFGSGPYDIGFPPEENDQEDLSAGLEGGIYFLEITAVYDTADMELNCVWRDTLNIFIDSLRLLCPSGDAYLFAETPDTPSTYQWQVDSLNGFMDVNPDAHHSGTTSPLLFLMDMPSSWYGNIYRCRLIHAMDTTFTEPFKLRFGLCKDSTISHWANPSAWHCNIVPDSYTDVYITDTNSFFGVFSNAFCRSLTLLPGSSMIIVNPYTITIDGDP